MSRRLDPLEPYAEHDEELPEYDSLAPLPNYLESAHQNPRATFRLCQLTRKCQILEPQFQISGDESPSYRISLRSAPRMFSKKADIAFSELGSLTQPLTLATTTTLPGEKEIAGANYSTTGSIPWVPRASISYPSRPGTSVSDLQSRNFTDWTFEINEKKFIWRMAYKPTCIVLIENEDEDPNVLARFTHSAIGTLATKGAEVGELAIYNIIDASEQIDFATLVLTLAVSMTNLKRMGRNYKNDGHDTLRSMSLASNTSIRQSQIIRTSSIATVPGDRLIVAATV